MEVGERTHIQSQAAAAWSNYLEQQRLTQLVEELAQQDLNLSASIATLKVALGTITTEIVQRGRGGIKGMHGFIAEITEVGLGNARLLVKGQQTAYTLLDDNSAVDFIKGGVDVQQKFWMSGGRFSLNAIGQHLAKYPDYVANGGRYQIPADQYAQVRTLLDMPQEVAAKLSRAGEGLSYEQWKYVREFFSEGAVPFEAVEPSLVNYSDVQVGTYETTFKAEEESIRATDERRRSQAYSQSKPSLGEGLKAAGLSAAFEGSIEFTAAVRAKIKDGTRIRDLREEDWRDILAKTALGTGKGTFRGGAVYLIVTRTVVPAAVAAAMVSAAMGVADQIYLLRRGEISGDEFARNVELLALESSITALSAMLGQALIPVPIFGAILGSLVGVVIFRIARSYFSKEEQGLLIPGGQGATEEDVNPEEAVVQVEELATEFLEVVGAAFPVDPSEAWLHSVEVARMLGVAESDILDTVFKRDAYFLE